MSELDIRRRVLLELFTKRELDTLISLVEMTIDQSGASFGDWLYSNPDEEATLESVDSKLRRLEELIRQQCDRRLNTMVTLQLRLSEESEG